jgi:hypothetical protein
MIKIGIKGKIIKGSHSPNGELIVEKGGSDNYGDYYIYIWPNDGTKWTDTDEDMIYDLWLENWEWVEGQFKREGWEVEWYDEEKKN